MIRREFLALLGWILTSLGIEVVPEISQAQDGENVGDSANQQWGCENWLTERLQSLQRYGADIVRGKDDLGQWIKMYTENHQYIIRLSPTYMGAFVECRKPRDGEDWLRGNDLPDGKPTPETWNRIVDGILSYELVRLSNLVRR